MEDIGLNCGGVIQVLAACEDGTTGIDILEFGEPRSCFPASCAVALLGFTFGAQK